MPFFTEMNPDTGLVGAVAKDKGAELQASYMNADPFPHVAIDDFLPSEILDACLREFPQKSGDGSSAFDRDQERLKTQFNPDALSPRVRTLFYSFNSLPFIRVLQNITGIKGLIPDPYFLGAGFHEISNGGHLSVHTDFNHHLPMNLERRINVLVYLNQNWDPSFGGQIELWNRDMSRCVKSYEPAFNRCVIFNTTDQSFHGNPNVVNNPRGETRKSIALYYYTSTWSDAKREHTTQFKVRRGSGDKVDAAIRGRELIADVVPPIVLRAAKRLAGGRGG